MENRFLGLIENSIKEHWDLPAFSDYNGHTFHYKDVARRIEKFHIILEHAGIKKGDKVALVGRYPESDTGPSGRCGGQDRPSPRSTGGP